MRATRHLLTLTVITLALVAMGCEGQVTVTTNPNGSGPATTTVTQLGPSTTTPAIAQALANGQPVDITQKDPNGNWAYAVTSKGQGDMKVSFQLGTGQGAPGQTAGNAQAVHQSVKDRLAASRARHAQRQQAMQQRLAAMKARAGTTPNALPINASFNIHIDGNFDADALKAQLTKLQQAAQNQTGAKGLTWSLGIPKTNPAHTSGATTPLAAPIGSPQATGATQQAPQVVYVPVPMGGQAPAGAQAVAPGAAPAAVQQNPIAMDDTTRDAIEETAELYLWLGAKGELDDARDLVVERCQDGPVGHVQAITFLDQPLELTESQVTAKRLRSGAATVGYDLTGTLTQEGDQGAIASSVNLTGDLTLVDTDQGWLISCPE
jgi:hypothetical protein